MATNIYGVFFFDLAVFPSFNITNQSNIEILPIVCVMTLYAFLGIESASIPAGNVSKAEKTIPFATMFGTMVGYLYYPWAYASASGHYAMITLTVIEAIGYIFCVKVAEEGTTKKSNGQIAAALAGTTAIMLYVSMYVS